MISLLLILVTAVGLQWDITFEPHADNIGVIVVTDCKGKVPYFAYDRVDLVEEFQSHIRMRRQPTPKGARCTVMASVMRVVEGDDDPAHEYIGESVIVIQEN